MANRNFARGDAPPSHSYEWAGVAKPPGTTAGAAAAKQRQAAGIPVMIAVSETVVVKKRKPWLWVIGGAIGGFFLGYKTKEY